MSYSTVDQFKTRYPSIILKLLSDDESGSTINDQRIQSALDRAQRIIHQFINSKYTLPLNPVPEIITDWEQEIALYDLYQRWRDDDRRNQIYELYLQDSKDAKGILPRVRDGELIIYGAENSIKKKQYTIQYRPIHIPSSSMSLYDYDSEWKEK